ncbi:CHAT domain-containing protein, partial [Gymnopilus junonius]
QTKAVQLLPEGHMEMPNILNNLGISFYRRFIETGDSIDLAEAISSYENSVRLTPEDHAAMPTRLNNLGISLQRRFEQTKNYDDLTEAISLIQRSVKLAPEGHPELPTQYNNLGFAYRSSFSRRSNLADLAEGISSIQKAIQIAPGQYQNMSIFLSNLAVSLQMRFDHTGDLDDSSQAISSLKEAVRLTPNGHPDMIGRLTNLGLFFEHRFEETTDFDDINTAISTFRDAATNYAGSPADRYQAAKKWVETSELFDESQSLEAYRTLIPLISQVAGLGQTVQKRYSTLPDMSHMSTSAAAAAFKEGRYELALEWLEESRCLVWRQLNNLRTPLDTLRDHDPAVYADVFRVSRLLDSAGSRSEVTNYTPDTISIEQKVSIQDQTLNHLKLAQNWDQLLLRVREIPGYEDFLKPVPYSTIVQGLPDSGFIVVINVHRERTDALVLRSGTSEPIHIPLEEFSYEKAFHLRNALKAYLGRLGCRMRGPEFDSILRGMRPARNDPSSLKEVLKQLWMFVAKPILNAIGISVGNLNSSTPVSDKQRIWWCTTGPLAFLPIHAAGIYEDAEHVTLPDLVISSYTPTITTLTGRAKDAHPLDEKTSGILMVSQPRTPGLSPIPGTTEEVQGLEELLKHYDHRHIRLDDAQGNVQQVLENLDTYSCVHLAYHAIQSTGNPLSSGFYLYDGQLRLSEIIQKNMAGADLAFLSACQTSAGDEKLSEEAVHLAAGMLAAGYRGVIATMWSIQDRYGPEVAEYFYEHILDKNSGKIRGESAAEL